MLLIRGEKRCLAHTLILAAAGIRVVLLNGTFISVLLFLTLLRPAARSLILCRGRCSVAAVLCCHDGGDSSLSDSC